MRRSISLWDAERPNFGGALRRCVWLARVYLGCGQHDHALCAAASSGNDRHFLLAALVLY